MTLKPAAIFVRFMVTPHTEPRVQRHVPKEETFTTPLKYIDVARSAHADLDVLQEKKIDDYWNVDSSWHLSDSCRGFMKFTLLREKLPKGYMWWREETDKDSDDFQISFVFGQKFGRKLVKRLTMETNNGGRKMNQSLTMLESWEELTLSIQMTIGIRQLSKTQGEKREDLWHQPCLVRETNSILASWKRMQSKRLAMN